MWDPKKEGEREGGKEGDFPILSCNVRKGWKKSSPAMGLLSVSVSKGRGEHLK